MRKEINDFTVTDLETTGFYPNNRILEFGAVRYRDGIPVATFQQYASYRGKLPEHIKKITGITEEILKEKGIHKDDAYNRMMQFIGDDLLVAHNMEFDWSFLEYHNPICNETGEPLHKLNNKTQCTLKLARKLNLDVVNNKLGTLCEYFNIEPERYHSALYDAQATGELFLKLQSILIEASKPKTITVNQSSSDRHVSITTPISTVQQHGSDSSTMINEPQPNTSIEELAIKRRNTAGISGIFLGFFGIHNFMYGYYIKGIMQLGISLLSAGFLSPFVWMWALVESILILLDKIKPSNKDIVFAKRVIYYAKNLLVRILNK